MKKKNHEGQCLTCYEINAGFDRQERKNMASTSSLFVLGTRHRVQPEYLRNVDELAGEDDQ
jgi:hypothetical protein